MYRRNLRNKKSNDHQCHSAIIKDSTDGNPEWIYTSENKTLTYTVYTSSGSDYIVDKTKEIKFNDISFNLSAGDLGITSTNDISSFIVENPIIVDTDVAIPNVININGIHDESGKEIDENNFFVKKLSVAKNVKMTFYTTISAEDVTIYDTDTLINNHDKPIENPFESPNTKMTIIYTDKSHLEEVENVYSTKKASLIKFDMNEDIELDKTLHVYSFSFTTNKNITMTNNESNSIVVFCDKTRNNYKKEGASEFTNSSDTDSVQINDAVICCSTGGKLTVKNLKLKNCTFGITNNEDGKIIDSILNQSMSIVDCTFLTKQKIEVYETGGHINGNLEAFKSNTFLEGILLDNRLGLDKVEGKFLIKGDVSTYDNNNPDAQYGYIDIVEKKSENQLKVERRTLHDDMSPYNIDLDSENYTQVVLDDINKGSMYTSKLYSDKTSYLQWLCECQTKCTKGIILMEKGKSNINQFIEDNKSKYDITVSEISVENDDTHTVEVEYFQSWEDITGDPQYSTVSAKASLEEILQTKDINEMKRLLNEWQYKCMYLSYKNGSVIFTKDIVGNNVTFSLNKGEETLFIDDLLNKTTLKDYSDYTINAVDYKIQRKKENKDIYILNDEDQNVKNGWVYTDKIYRLMMKYFNGSRIDDKPPESTMSNEEMANIMTLISTRLTTEDEEKEGLMEIIDKIEEAMNIIYTKEQKYDREEVNYSLKEYQKIRNAFEEWRNYYIPSPSEYFKTAEIMIWRPMELEMKNVEEISSEIYNPQYIIDYYNNIYEKYKEEKKKKWVINEQDEKNLELIIFEDATDSEYGEMMNEIQGARNRLQRYDSPNKLIVIMGTNYGDIYSVFGKEDLINVVPIETFFKIKNTNELIYIPYDKRDSDTNWAIDKWLFTKLYDFIFEPMMYYINDSSPFKGLLGSINDIRYLGYVMIKQEEKGMIRPIEKN